MYHYIIGMIVKTAKDYIVVDHQGIGYLVYVCNPFLFKKGQEQKVFLYQHVKEDDIKLFGFHSEEEKDLFLKLILVKGIGCKTAIGMLATGTVDDIIGAIETSNITYLKKIPGIGPKAAQQIILDLQGKLTMLNTSALFINPAFDEAAEVLEALGYKKAEVDKALGKIKDDNLDTNGYVKKALSVLVQL